MDERKVQKDCNHKKYMQLSTVGSHVFNYIRLSSPILLSADCFQ